MKETLEVRGSTAMKKGTVVDIMFARKNVNPC